MKIYISGPMRGLPSWNEAAFREAAQRWRAAGHQAFNPWALANDMGYGGGCPAEPDGGDGSAHLKHVSLSDVACLLAADAIALLPGWERSRGATWELALAQFLGLKIFCAISIKPLQPPICPYPHPKYWRTPG